MKKQKEDKEITREESFKAVYEYAAWGTLFHACKTHIRNFIRFLLDALSTPFR